MKIINENQTKINVLMFLILFLFVEKREDYSFVNRVRGKSKNSVEIENASMINVERCIFGTQRRGRTADVSLFLDDCLVQSRCINFIER